MSFIRPEVRNCQRCGKLFLYTGVPICRDCLAKEDDQYAAVKAYLNENPGATVPEVSKATDVPAEVIADFIRRGLLVMTGVGETEARCRICGKPIQSGQVCQTCLESLSSVVGHVHEPVPEAPRTTTVPEPSDKRAGQVYIMDIINRNRRRRS